LEALSKKTILSLIAATPATAKAKRVRYRDRSIIVVMPCWNEEGKVGPGVAAVPRDLVDTVCVVNNGSIDRTAEEAREAGATVIDHPINQGAGGGIRSGLFYGLQNGFDLLAVLAGDNQDNPEDLRHVADKLIDEDLDYVQGSRWMKDGKRINMTMSRKILTWVYSFLFTRFFGVPISDATNGFRLFKAEILEDDQINLWQDWMLAYELEPYLLIKTCQLGYKVGQAPVQKTYHDDMKENTKMVPFKSWWSILRPLFFLRFGIKK
tara:strand:- start:1143 stop:1937 length:795 start_codon:yes stop_codon:yes gene_type:complete